MLILCNIFIDELMQVARETAENDGSIKQDLNEGLTMKIKEHVLRWKGWKLCYIITYDARFHVDVDSKKMATGTDAFYNVANEDIGRTTMSRNAESRRRIVILFLFNNAEYVIPSFDNTSSQCRN